jgi:predicted DNA-binding protein (MmcQ/YjbR family)
MNVEEYRDYCINKIGVTEGFPFGETTLVFKVMGKIFTLSGIENFVSINLKCIPELAIDLREEYNSIKPGFHMNKKHWNTVQINGDVNDKKIYELIDLSYNLVVKSLTKKLKDELTLLK